jgi:hypothetical protein
MSTLRWCANTRLLSGRRYQTYPTRLHLNSHISNLNFLRNLRWRNVQNKSFRSRKVMQLCILKTFFIWNHLTKENYGRIFSHLNFNFFSYDLGWIIDQKQSYRSQKVIKLYSW